MKRTNTQNYGKELGYGIKEGLKGLNTVASPKSKKKCEKLMIIPLLTCYISITLIGITNAEGFLGTFAVFPFLISCLLMGSYQFYLGKFKNGIIYTLTLGLFTFGVLIDLFKLKVTHTLKDSNGFPLIY